MLNHTQMSCLCETSTFLRNVLIDTKITQLFGPECWPFHGGIYFREDVQWKIQKHTLIPGGLQYANERVLTLIVLFLRNICKM